MNLFPIFYYRIHVHLSLCLKGSELIKGSNSAYCYEVLEFLDPCRGRWEGEGISVVPEVACYFEDNTVPEEGEGGALEEAANILVAFFSFFAFAINILIQHYIGDDQAVSLKIRHKHPQYNIYLLRICGGPPL